MVGIGPSRGSPTGCGGLWLGIRHAVVGFYCTRRRGRRPGVDRGRPCRPWDAAHGGTPLLAFWQNRWRMPSMARQGALKCTAQTCAAEAAGSGAALGACSAGISTGRCVRNCSAWRCNNHTGQKAGVQELRDGCRAQGEINTARAGSGATSLPSIRLVTEGQGLRQHSHGTSAGREGQASSKPFQESGASVAHAGSAEQRQLTAAPHPHSQRPLPPPAALIHAPCGMPTEVHPRSRVLGTCRGEGGLVFCR